MSNKTVFAQLIIDKMSGKIGTDGKKFNDVTPFKAQMAIASAITEWITTYVHSKSSYTGVGLSTPFPPDPIIEDDHQIVGTCSIAGTHPDLEGWLGEIAANIIAGFSCAPGQQTVTFAAPYMPFAGSINVTTDDLKSVHEDNPDDPQLACWEVITQAIIDMIVNNVSGIPMAAMRPGQSQSLGPTAFVTYNYIFGGSSNGKRRSCVTYMRDDYLDWDSDTWDDYLWY